MVSDEGGDGALENCAQTLRHDDIANDEVRFLIYEIGLRSFKKFIDDVV